MFHFHWIFCIFTLCIPFTIFPQFSNNKITFRCSSITIYIEHHTSRFHFYPSAQLPSQNQQSKCLYLLYQTLRHEILPYHKSLQDFSWIQAQRFVEVSLICLSLLFLLFHSASPYKTDSIIKHRHIFNLLNESSFHIPILFLMQS